MDRIALKIHRRQQRKRRVRKKISGNAIIPRISVYKSNRHFSLQAVDDQKGFTIASAATYEPTHRDQAKKKSSTQEIAQLIGSQLANRLLEKKITRVVYDCNGNKYHGIIKVIADSMRSAGVQL